MKNKIRIPGILLCMGAFPVAWGQSYAQSGAATVHIPLSKSLPVCEKFDPNRISATKMFRILQEYDAPIYQHTAFCTVVNSKHEFTKAGHLTWVTSGEPLLRCVVCPRNVDRPRPLADVKNNPMVPVKSRYAHKLKWI